MLDRTPISERARGRWQDILVSLGVPERVLNRKPQPCPFCGGKDRFTWDDKAGSGSFICRHCGAGDGVAFVKRFLKCEFVEAAKAIEGHIGAAQVRAPKAWRGEDAQKAAMMALWREGRPLNGIDLASRYLKARGIDLPSWPAALRFVGDLAYYDEKHPKVRSYMPGMIANFRSVDDKTGILHRSYLREPGVRADIAKKTMMMPGRVPDGGAVQIGPIAETMGIAEGIETALSASILFKVTVWAACSATNLIKWIPPDGCRNVIVFGDLDASFAGQQASYCLAYRLRNLWVDKEKTVRFGVEVRFTQFHDQGQFREDWNDAIRSNAT